MSSAGERVAASWTTTAGAFRGPYVRGDSGQEGAQLLALAEDLCSKGGWTWALGQPV